ncbi:MAG: hypothetical protein EOP62_14425 [Sphingomonadales bacterium]|nr:MAG: hypothetical protein EOP62_14425 [Sphingomonadales bacterium]
MHAIDSAGSINGEFSEGNPGTGQRATKVTAEWLNDVQANLLAVLEAGEIDAEKGRAQDLLQAIQAVVAGAVGTGGGAVPTTRKVLGAGLVTQSSTGALSADVTLTVAAASGPELAGGIVNNKVVTPASMAAALGNGTGGSITFPGGFTDKFGTYLVGVSPGTYFVGFAIPFTAGCGGVVACPINASGSANRDVWVQVVSFSADGFTMCIQTSNTGGNNTLDGFSWRAWGL